MTAEPSQPRPLFSGVFVPLIYLLGLFTLVTVFSALDSNMYVYLSSHHLQATPLGSSTAGESLLPLFYLAATAVFTFVLVRVLRHKIRKGFSLLMAGAFLLLIIGCSLEVFWFLYLPLVILIAYVPWSLFIYGIIKNKSRYWSYPFVTLVAAEFGVTFVLVFPRLSLFVMPLAYACWDIFAVFRGPLKQLASASVFSSRSNNFFILRIGSSGIGYGDLFFYSLTLALACTFSGLTAGIVSGLLLFGSGLTLLLLRSGNHKALPALPLPIFLSVGFLVLVSLHL